MCGIAWTLREKDNVKMWWAEWGGVRGRDRGRVKGEKGEKDKLTLRTKVEWIKEQEEGKKVSNKECKKKCTKSFQIN